jgi:hypothetical protein
MNRDTGPMVEPSAKNAYVEPRQGRQTPLKRLADGSMQAEPLCQGVKRSTHNLLRYSAEQPVEVRIIERVHAAFERFCIIGTIKEPRRDAQSTDPVTGGPGGTNLVGLATHVVNQRRKCASCR